MRKLSIDALYDVACAMRVTQDVVHADPIAIPADWAAADKREIYGAICGNSYTDRMEELHMPMLLYLQLSEAETMGTG